MCFSPDQLKLNSAKMTQGRKVPEFSHKTLAQNRTMSQNTWRRTFITQWNLAKEIIENAFYMPAEIREWLLIFSTSLSLSFSPSLFLAHTHICTSVFVGTLVMHSQSSNAKYHNQIPDPNPSPNLNLNPGLSWGLNPILDPQTWLLNLWRTEKCPNFPKMSSLGDLHL